MKRLLMLTSITIGLLSSFTSIANTKTINPSAEKVPKSIIMVVGDGMGPAYTTAYRYLKDDVTTPLVELTVFDQLLVGMSSTYPVLSQGYVTDSAAAATALATGYKTYNGAISVDTDKKHLLTLMEQAKKIGKKTGLAVTSQINHATPAAYFSHNESRGNYNAIADSYFDSKINGKFVADVMLGGGTKYFIRPDRNLVEEFKAAGYQYADNFAELAQLNKNQPVLGLFASSGMPWALDSKNDDRLLTLSKTAIKHLENEKGYVLLIEASQIDWAGHSNDIASAMGEMDDLASTLTWLKKYVENRDDTLLVVTADHSTGGLTVAANGVYMWQPEVLKTMSASPRQISSTLAQSSTLSEAEINQIVGFDLSDVEHDIFATINDKMSYEKQLKIMIDRRTNTGWTTGGHTGIDVQVFATGAGSQAFSGHQTNTDIASKIFTILANQ